MKICHVTSGRTSVPSREWYWIEEAVWAMRSECLAHGHSVYILNSGHPSDVIDRIRKIGPDVVHFHDDVMSLMATGIEAPIVIVQCYTAKRFTREGVVGLRRVLGNRAYIGCSSKLAFDFLIQSGFNKNRLCLMLAGVKAALVDFSPVARFERKSLCFGIMDSNLRCADLMGYEDIDCFEPLRDSLRRRESSAAKCLKQMRAFKGMWGQAEACRKMQQYANLVALNQHDVAPFIVSYALAAGLGLVVSEAMAANVDLAKPFIQLVPESRMHDRQFIRAKIEDNREICVTMRREIRRYAVERFDWGGLAKTYIKDVTAMVEQRYCVE